MATMTTGLQVPDGRGGMARPIPVVDPSSEEVVATFAPASPVEIDRAVRRARAALPGWSGLSEARRGAILTMASRRLRGSVTEVAKTLMREAGSSRGGVAFREVAQSAALLERLPRQGAGDVSGRRAPDALLIDEPVGVVAAITPSQQPLLQTVATIGPALLAGCTVVLKPSTLAPHNALCLRDVLEAAGLPAGVLTVVLGHGGVTGQALVRHEQVDLIAFTGSFAARQRIAVTAAEAGKDLVARSAGGAATVLLESCDEYAAVGRVVRGHAYRWTEGRLALGRLVVPRARLQAVERLVVKEVARLGASVLAAIPPAATRGQQVATLELIEGAVAGGATVLVGGAAAPRPSRGFHLPLTVLSQVGPEMDVARYEAVGPVLCLMPHDGVADAVRVANLTPGGVLHEVWSHDMDAALLVARGLDVPAVRVNGRALSETDARWHPDNPVPRQAFTRQKTVVIANRS